MSTTQLQNLITELQDYKTDKNSFLIQAVSDRLTKSLETYNHELKLSLDYLERSDALRVMKKLNKAQQ